MIKIHARDLDREDYIDIATGPGKAFSRKDADDRHRKRQDRAMLLRHRAIEVSHSLRV
ncbi:MAG: hypothetical protein J0I79_32015 [Mesorhizobium sp.]|nr:hypothetical protein [Mesorhizobium sp.]